MAACCSGGRTRGKIGGEGASGNRSFNNNVREGEALVQGGALLNGVRTTHRLTNCGESQQPGTKG